MWAKTWRESRAWWWRMVVSVPVVASATVAVAGTAAGAAPPPKPTITHISETFTCFNTEIGLVGGGTLTAVERRTALTPLEGETSRTHVTGKYRFVAENGERQTYRIDYVRNYSEDRGSAIWEGRFLIDDVSTANYWYADPGGVEFGPGAMRLAARPGGACAMSSDIGPTRSSSRRSGVRLATSGAATDPQHFDAGGSPPTSPSRLDSQLASPPSRSSVLRAAQVQRRGHRSTDPLRRWRRWPKPLRPLRPAAQGTSSAQ